MFSELSCILSQYIEQSVNSLGYNVYSCNISTEVKSGRTPSTFPGIEAFASKFRVTRKLLVGGTGIPLEEFLATPAEAWL